MTHKRVCRPSNTPYRRNGFPVLSSVRSRASDSHNASSPVVINAFVRTGSAAEPRDRHGLTQFMTEMLIRGTHTRSAGELWESVESLGASLGVSHTKHTIVFSAKCLAEDTFTLLGLLGDIQRNPTFPDPEIERCVARCSPNSTSACTRHATSVAQFPRARVPSDHPYSAPDIGTPESVSAISRKRPRRASSKRTVRYRPVIIVIVGRSIGIGAGLHPRALGKRIWFTDRRIDTVSGCIARTS